MNAMESNSDYTLQKRIDLWINDLKSIPSLTDSDSEELRTHLIDTIEYLKKTGLDDEESFIIASKRIGNISDLAPNYHEVNNSVLQMRKSLIILAGVLAYFLLYFFFLLSSKLLFIGVVKLGSDNLTAMICVKRYLLTSHFIIIIVLISIYFFDKLTVKFIEKTNLKPWHTILLVVTAIVFGISDACLLPIIKNLIRNGMPVENQFYNIYFYFKYSFPFLICIGFVLLFFKYFNKTKVHN
jgi:hypothetical protein